MENNIQLRIHKVSVLPDNLIKGHIYFEHSTGRIHIATSETEKQTFGGIVDINIQRITEGLDENVKEAYALIGEDGEEKGDRILIYKDEKVSQLNSDSIIIPNKIPVIGGPLSNLLVDAGIKEIDADTNLQDLLVSLFCQEIWPKSTNIQRVVGSVSGHSTANSCTMTIKNGSTTLTSGALVYPGTKLSTVCTQSSLSDPTSTNSKISGLSYGYSFENDGEKNSEESYIEKTWTIVPKNSSAEYKINLTVNGTTTTYQGTSVLKNQTGEFTVTKGLNSCQAASYGRINYDCSIEEIPTCYWVSNLGNTYKDKYTNGIPSQETTITCGNMNSPQSTSSFTVYGTLPTFHNVSSNVLNSDTIIEMQLSSSKTFTIENIPSEENSDNMFMFDFPSSVSISSMKVLPLPEKYNVYSNIDLVNDTITTNANYNHGKWSNTISITNVPSEVNTGKRFILEYPACVTISLVTALNDANGKMESYSQYKTENITRGSDSYTRLTMTHQKESGPTKYSFTFSNAVEKNTTLNVDYNIQSGIKKTINNIEYSYNRLISKIKSGYAKRTITLNKSLNT